MYHSGGDIDKGHNIHRGGRYIVNPCTFHSNLTSELKPA